MSNGGDMGSVSRWLGELRAGNQEAAEPLWGRYFARLTHLAAAARRRGRFGLASPEADSEDAALSAFDSFCDGAARGRFPQLADRTDLWRLLAVITIRKVRAQARRAGSLKRGGSVGLDPADTSHPLEAIPGYEPDPGTAVLEAEGFDGLMALLDDDALRQVACDRLDGYTNDEIAQRLGCARRTVARRLDLIRGIWLEAAAAAG